MKKVKFITPTDEMGASSRYRVYQYLEYLKDDFDYEVYPFMTDKVYRDFKQGNMIKFIIKVPFLIIKRLKLLLKCKKDEILFIHRDVIPFGPMIIERLLKLKGCKIILDLDDAVYSNETEEISNSKNRILYKFKYGKRFNTSIKNSNLVICGNEFIEKHVQIFNRNTVIIPTTIDTNKVKYNKIKKDSKSLKICWIGNPGNTNYVLKILPEINEIAKKLKKDIIITLIGAKEINKDEFKNLKIEIYPWNLETEYSLIQENNIGIMPLNDSEWSRGKCGLKLLQYMAVGVPGLATKVGVNQNIIKTGKNGFLIDTNESTDWANIIKSIIEENVDLNSMGEFCRKFVEENYSVNVWKEKLKTILNNL